MRWLSSLVLFAVACGAQHVAPEVIQLARIKMKMNENLQHLPNYTCLQTIERSVRSAGTGRYKPVDTLRLEVALVDGKELFAFPGEQRFQDREISELAPGGAIGNGDFALHAKAVFLSNMATFEYLDREQRDGREVLKYSYRVPQFGSGYSLRVGSQQAVVGFHGVAWADAKSFDLVHLEVDATDIPPILQLKSATVSMEYRRISIGGSDFLLPQWSELTMVDIRGGVSHNRTSFSGCRQYTGQSVVSFDEAPVERGPAPAKVEIKEISLPENLWIDANLKTAVMSNGSAVGDPIEAVVSSAVKQGRKVILPKGAILTGRITRLEKVSLRDTYAVGLEFTLAEFPGTRARMRAEILRHGRDAAGTPLSQVRTTLATPPDGFSFYVSSPRGPLVLLRGYMILLRTLKPSNSNEDKP